MERECQCTLLWKSEGDNPLNPVADRGSCQGVKARSSTPCLPAWGSGVSEGRALWFCVAMVILLLHNYTPSLSFSLHGRARAWQREYRHGKQGPLWVSAGSVAQQVDGIFCNMSGIEWSFLLCLYHLECSNSSPSPTPPHIWNFGDFPFCGFFFLNQVWIPSVSAVDPHYK